MAAVSLLIALGSCSWSGNVSYPEGVVTGHRMDPRTLPPAKPQTKCILREATTGAGVHGYIALGIDEIPLHHAIIEAYAQPKGIFVSRTRSECGGFRMALPVGWYELRARDGYPVGYPSRRKRWVCSPIEVIVEAQRFERARIPCRVS